MGRTVLLAAVAIGLGGCATGPLQENPLFIRTDKEPTQGNPLYIPQGPMDYARVFEKVIDVLDDYWDIAYHNRYDGRIETHPRVAPGLEQPWKPGSPDFHERLLASLQSIRHRAIVTIRTADDGGYFIDVKVLKELEDLPAPIRATAGAAVFRMMPTVERQFEVIEPDLIDTNWIPAGRDPHLEQVLLQRIAHMDLNEGSR
jgi:hypothetical protein